MAEVESLQMMLIDKRMQLSLTIVIQCVVDCKGSCLFLKGWFDETKDFLGNLLPQDWHQAVPKLLKCRSFLLQVVNV